MMGLCLPKKKVNSEISQVCSFQVASFYYLNNLIENIEMELHCTSDTMKYCHP